MTKVQRDITRKIRVLQHARAIKNISKTCRFFWISRQCFSDWQKTYHQYGKGDLKSLGACRCAGSSPDPGINDFIKLEEILTFLFFVSLTFS